MEAKDMPHVLLFPLPAQGHISPMLDLAELLSHAGDLHVTFLNTEHIHSRLFANPEALNRFARIPSLRFRTIPDGFPKDDPRPFLKLMDIIDSMRLRSSEQYKKLLLADGEEADGWPQVTCVVADGFLPVALEVAEEVNIPVMILRASSACSIWSLYCIPRLIESGEFPFAEEGDLDKAIKSVPGMERFLRRRDLSSFIREAESTEDGILQFVITTSSNMTRGTALILNTIESLEAPVNSLLHSICPLIYTLGPIHNLVNTKRSHLPSENAHVATGLWQEDHTCLKWLDSQPPKSVVYVSFGSITVISREELLEFWHGLANSGHGFLWVVRPDLVEEWRTNKNERTTPPELEEATRVRGCLVSWAPQREVLAHPSVGCFLTHSGWNSTLESIVAGVPMICWPVLGDQQINSRYVSEVWKIGVDMKDKNERGIVEKMVREVMDSEKAEELRKNTSKMAAMAKESTREGGSSYQNIERLIQHIKCLNAKT